MLNTCKRSNPDSFIWQEPDNNQRLSERFRGYKLCQCHVGMYLLLAEDWSATHDSFRRLTAFISGEGRQMNHTAGCVVTELSEKLAGFRHCQQVVLQYLSAKKNVFSTAESQRRLAMYLERMYPITQDTEDDDYEELALYDEMQDNKALTLLVELWQTSNFAEFVKEAGRIREQFEALLDIGDSSSYDTGPEGIPVSTGADSSISTGSDSPISTEPDYPVNMGPENLDLYIRNCPDDVMPEQTTGDGEGHVYQSISRLLHRSELFQHRLRLATVVHAASNHVTYEKQYFKMFESTPFEEVIDYFRRRVHGKSVCPCWDVPDDKERVIRLHVRHLIREAARPDRYSSHIQLQFLCDALGRTIIEHYETPQLSLHGTHHRVQPMDRDDESGSTDQDTTSQPLQIMWINYEREPGGILNHAIPLIPFQGHHIWKWPSTVHKVCSDRNISAVQLGVQQASVRLSARSDISNTLTEAHSHLSSGNSDTQFSDYVKVEKFLLNSVWPKFPNYGFNAHAAVMFRSLRENVFGLDEDEWMQSLCGNVTEHAGETDWFHPSWRLYFSTEDGRFAVHSISDQDSQSVVAFLPQYYGFMVQYASKCLLPNFYGLYSYTQKSVISPRKLHLLVTDTYPLESHEMYLVKPAVTDDGSNHPEGMDNHVFGDFYTTYAGGVLLDTEAHQMLTDMVQEHVTLLESQNFTGYSMLIGIQRLQEIDQKQRSIDQHKEDGDNLQRNNNENSSIDDLNTQSTPRIEDESGLWHQTARCCQATSTSGEKLVLSLRIVDFLTEQSRPAVSGNWLKSWLSNKVRPVSAQHYAQLFRRLVLEEVLKPLRLNHVGLLN